MISVRPNDTVLLKKCINSLKVKCYRISKPSNIFSVIYDYFFETSLGTLDQLRIELESNFTAKRVKLPVSKKVNLDMMIILPLIKDESARAKDLRARILEHQLEDKDANASRDNSLKNSHVGLRMNDSGMGSEAINIVLMCQPNSQPYELCFYEQVFLKFFLENNMHLVLWNYRGYGRSGGSPTLEVIFSQH